MEIKNAKVTRTFLGREDHGILTFSIYVHTDMYDVGVGGYALDRYDQKTDTRVITANGLAAISEILDVVGVDTWEQLPGTYIRIKDPGWGKPIDEIGNLIEDKWFNLRDFFSCGEHY